MNVGQPIERLGSLQFVNTHTTSNFSLHKIGHWKRPARGKSLPSDLLVNLEEASVGFGCTQAVVGFIVTSFGFHFDVIRYDGVVAVARRVQVDVDV